MASFVGRLSFTSSCSKFGAYAAYAAYGRTLRAIFVGGLCQDHLAGRWSKIYGTRTSPLQATMSEGQRPRAPWRDAFGRKRCATLLHPEPALEPALDVVALSNPKIKHAYEIARFAIHIP
jgi:hypothetical protein